MSPSTASGEMGAGGGAAAAACPACGSVNRSAQYGGQCPAADRPWEPHLGAGEEGVPRRGSASDLGVGLANKGSLGFYSTRISMSAATRDTGTDQQTGGAWERGLSQEGGPGDGRGPGHVAAPSSNSQLPQLDVRASGSQLAGQKQLSQSFRMGVAGGSQLPPKPRQGNRAPLPSPGCCFHLVTVPGGAWKQGSWPLWHQRFLQPKDGKALTWVPV